MIKNYKFGELKSSYKSCITSHSNNTQLDTCQISSSVNFLDEEWNGSLYFIDERLCRIELEENTLYLTASYYKLNALLGKPNQQPIKVINSTFKSVKPLIVGNDTREFRPYTETLNDILKQFIDAKNSSKNDIKLEEFELNKNEWLLNDKFKYEGDPIRVNIKYYPQIDLESIWQAKNILQWLVSRSTELQIGEPTTIGGGENKLHSGYRIVPRDYVKINFYDSKKTMDYFKKLEKEEHLKSENEKHQKEIKEDKEILNKF